MPSPLPPLEFGASRDEASISVILMHGLGADANDFADVAAALCQAAAPRKWRFVLPNAPVLPVTINAGMRMPAWYDILDLSHPRAVDWDTVEESRLSIDALADREVASKLVFAGFSQGGAMALHAGLRRAKPLDGILVLSGYLLESEDNPCPSKESDCPIAIFHGSEDSMVSLTAAERTKEALSAAGHAPSMKVYQGMEHSVCDEEIQDLFAWLDTRFP